MTGSDYPKPLKDDPAQVVLGVIPPATLDELGRRLAADYFDTNRFRRSWLQVVADVLEDWPDRNRVAVTALGRQQLQALYGCLDHADDRIAMVRILDLLPTLPQPPFDLVAAHQHASSWAENGYSPTSREYWSGIRDTLSVLLGHTTKPPAGAAEDAAAATLFGHLLHDRANTTPRPAGP